ncbi:MAG: phosphoribosylaminoimidazolesuccinocarboxamide synthase, partial [Deltaproteobacteria bacterium]|nr:phosphoribosylaminoimidazolesuccinocarboxamide synthase [Deltaproteobacteria bacterium]
SDLPGQKLLFRGKVRDVYDLGDALLIVATDRLSAFDVVLPTPIPGKGEILTQLSNFWFAKLASASPNHLTGRPVRSVLNDESLAARYADRSVVVAKAEPLKVEAIVRGYLAGSGLIEYREKGSVSGIALPPGLREADRLPAPIFTPSTKAPRGTHDENISFDAAARIVGGSILEEVRARSLSLYKEAVAWAESRGILLADTKFEFGLLGGNLTLIDEILTPDSSRFWPAAGYTPGHSQPSFDKQFVRDFLLSLKWNKQPPGPVLPHDVIRKTLAKYREALERLSR